MNDREIETSRPFHEQGSVSERLKTVRDGSQRANFVIGKFFNAMKLG